MKDRFVSDKIINKTAMERASDEIAPERLVQAGKAVADLAHLAKNIIQVMSGCGEIIDVALKTGQIDRVEKAWQLYQPSFWRLKKLQLDLIKYAKQYPINLQPCVINDVAASAIKQIEGHFSKRNITLVKRFGEKLPSITADGEKLREAVTNLLIVAADNLQDQAGTVTLETAFDAVAGQCCVAVSDSGPQLDEAARNALLYPFERCRNMLGTGLEIPLAKQVAQDHQGQLNLGTTPAGINRFEVVIPGPKA